MAMYENYRVNFTIYEDKKMGATKSNLAGLNQVVQAMGSSQAQAMVEAQYGRDNIVVHGVYLER